MSEHKPCHPIEYVAQTSIFCCFYFIPVTCLYWVHKKKIVEINTNVPCEECASPRENWICLHCFRTLCGRYVGEHMLYHHLDTEHPLTLSFSDLSVWCYKCESYIDNPMLYKYKNMAHVSKFGGEEMVWPYGSDTLHLTMDGTPKN